MRSFKTILFFLPLFISISFGGFKAPVYLAAAAALQHCSCLCYSGWLLCKMTSLTLALSDDFSMAGELFARATSKAFKRAFSKTRFHSSASWEENQKLLAEIPAESGEEKELLAFLKKRWLSKANGYFKWEVDWASSCFGIDVQVHPESNNSYARDPGTKHSGSYIQKIKEIKEEHPLSSHLILTRPGSVKDYLPLIEQFAPSRPFPGMELFKGSVGIQEGENWIEVFPTGDELAVETHKELLEWISLFGLTANQVEIHRCKVFDTGEKMGSSASVVPERESFGSFLNRFHWTPKGGPIDFMVQGELAVLTGLLSSTSEKKWEAVSQSKTKRKVASLCFSRIESGLERLEEGRYGSLFEAASKLEEVHVNLSSLLELLSPFEKDHFQDFYAALFPEIPLDLKFRAAVHSSGMTSLCGIFKAVAESRRGRPKVIYGENLYFEALDAANKVSQAVAESEASEQDWKEADLILAQFNPVLKRGSLAPPQIYREERVAALVRNALQSREKPFSLALDCTIDFLASDKVKRLIEEFAKEIASGQLNILCYRSGLKFDLYGMDNFAGAPFFMVHNGGSHWSSFERLLNDPALLTDPLSLNWFCLAYGFAAKYLDLYRKQIFENTRSILDRVPARLFDLKSRYRIVSMEKSVNAAFIDIKVSGPLHKIRTCACVGGCLYMNSMVAGHPIFYRRSIGFSHSNFGILFDENYSTLRLTVGLDPAAVELYVDCFRRIDDLNEG